MTNRTILTALGFILLSGSAQAAPRTVCLDLRFRDNRTSGNCAVAGETGHRRGCNPGKDLPHLGAILELWDKDADGSDERIGRYLYNYDQTCYTFEWDTNSTANAEHESNPDVYARYVNAVRNTGNTREVVAVQSDGKPHRDVWWRNGEVGEPDKYIAKDCRAGVECWTHPLGTWLLPSIDVNSDVATRAMVLDSAQHGLEAFASLMTDNVHIKVPDLTGTCPTACAASRTEIRLPGVFTDDGVRVTHELGHTIHMQLFQQDNLHDDCSKNGAGWSLASDEFDSCASQEGMATYIGAASWYDPGRENAQPTLWGYNFENPAPHAAVCSANRGLALQATKAFWDMADATNETAATPAPSGADDNDYWGYYLIVSALRAFPGGTGNGQTNESDADGVNVRDYIANTNASVFGGSTTQEETMLNHNCIDGQDAG